LTLSAVNAVPSEKVTSLRRSKVYSVPESSTVQSVASQGRISPVSGSWSVRESATLRITVRCSIQ